MKCTHGDDWSGCFREAIEHDHFSGECIENITSRMQGWFASRINHGEDVKDVLQEFSIALAMYFRNFDAARCRSGKSYVFAIARNICVQYLRKKIFTSSK